MADRAASAVAGGRQARWEPHNAERRARIVEAAIELVEQSPPGAVISAQLIAERAGLAKSVLYRQFSGRDELDRRVRSEIAARFVDALDSALDIADGSIAQIIARTVGVVVDWIGDHPRLHEFLRGGPAADDPVPRDALAGLLAAVADRAARLVTGLAGVVGVADPPVIDTMTFAIVSMTEATVTRWARDPAPALSREQLVAEVASYAWSILDGVARAHGIVLDPEQPLLPLLDELAALEPDQAARRAGSPR
ncbi:TetR/AcrR family transcriptional regulator [Nocardia sp. CDC159]|uniref:TetR/AcrR family transcriptional regulator n=1 Tax=Nocardia pulmonis TaxID=2951408 RepID=A0A9X2E8I4_9NOCA|nr:MULTISPECIES: TetR/AcrR family transcriptional regulator [Nocardia]MCM6775596.1 TetR/AcrR family transcriptional regulator [Nocardia pulmonis]MCM6787670.1 TetR/AcrR family transcriptional regulator [Nocardia sp. CDC159]